MARRKSLALADAIAKRALEGQQDEEAAPAPRRAYAAGREGLLQDLGEGRLQHGKIRLVDPVRCRMWAGHNRLYDLLTPEDAAPLIDSIKAMGRQETPAIVRPVRGEEGCDYEVIAGARRHFAVSHLRRAEHRDDIRFLVDVRDDLTDEEAFRIADVENREREDISDYERARDYARALTTYYDDNKKLMAERLGVDRTWLSRFVRMAALPEGVLAAYGDPRRLGIRHASELYPLLGGIGAKRLLKEAVRLADEQAARREAGREPVAPATVLARLKKAASGEEAPTRTVSTGADGRPLFTVEDRQRSVVVTIPRERLHALEEVMESLTKALLPPRG